MDFSRLHTEQETLSSNLFQIEVSDLKIFRSDDAAFKYLVLQKEIVLTSGKYYLMNDTVKVKAVEKHTLKEDTIETLWFC